MKINADPNLPTVSSPNFLPQLRIQLDRMLRSVAQQLNGITEGKIQNIHNSATAAPTAGTYQKGDFIRNSAPAEAGGAGSKYVIFGWVCVTAGTPGTWKECRFLTGN